MNHRGFCNLCRILVHCSTLITTYLLTVAICEICAGDLARHMIEEQILFIWLATLSRFTTIIPYTLYAKLGTT